MKKSLSTLHAPRSLDWSQLMADTALRLRVHLVEAL